MRISSLLLALCLIALLVPVAGAQTVVQDNVLVFYFDEGATLRSWHGTGEVTAYLVAGPMIDFSGLPYEHLDSWGANGMKIDPFENVAWATLTARGAASPATYDFTGDTLHAGFVLSGPLALSGRTVLAELTMLVTSSAPTYLTPCYEGGGSCDVDGVSRWFDTLTDGAGSPVTVTAVVNGDAPVPTTEASWSRVKALFR